jgi:hypothetical protein
MADARRFLESRTLTDGERHTILEQYGADWVLVDKSRPRPEEFLRRLRSVYEDAQYVLYEVGVS